MNKVISVEQDLELLARLAAGLLATPVVMITVYNRDNDDAGSSALADRHSVVSCDPEWAANHPDIDITQLGCPRRAMTQSLGLYASMPLRSGDGAIIGTVACAADEARELGDSEMAVLRHVTGLAAAVVAAVTDSASESVVKQKAVNFSA
ncbi:GAF domain-containing protein [Parasphingorhabdus sp.]|uniref:GAF domain-containing protein n=1 Tax=Parasphingorhabdus sp. TaxID=2709688 RepID=UPI002F954F5B